MWLQFQQGILLAFMSHRCSPRLFCGCGRLIGGYRRTTVKPPPRYGRLASPASTFSMISSARSADSGRMSEWQAYVRYTKRPELHFRPMVGVREHLRNARDYHPNTSGGTMIRTLPAWASRFSSMAVTTPFSNSTARLPVSSRVMWDNVRYGRRWIGSMWVV